MDPSTVVHPANTVRLVCACGIRLTFDEGSPWWTTLLSQWMDKNGKTGKCPECGCIHEVPAG